MHHIREKCMHLRGWVLLIENVLFALDAYPSVHSFMSRQK